VTHMAGTEAAEAALMNALYDEHATVLCRYAMRLTGDASRAEDVVQATLLRAWQPKSRSHNGRAGTPTHAARDGGDTMTALRPIRTPIGAECQLMMLSGDGLSS